MKARFLAEAPTAGSISHENILGIYDFGVDHEHRPFLVMEYLRGAIKNGRTAGPRNRLRSARAQFRSGRVKVMDFGISKREGQELSRTGHMVAAPITWRRGK